MTKYDNKKKIRITHVFLGYAPLVYKTTSENSKGESILCSKFTSYILYMYTYIELKLII
jgi:hypothetical protein